MGKRLVGVLKYKDVFGLYPERWVLVKPIIRKGASVHTMYVLESSDDKDKILGHAKGYIKQGQDVAVIPTIGSWEDSDQVVKFEDFGLEKLIEPKEYAFLFQMYTGSIVSSEYLM